MRLVVEVDDADVDSRAAQVGAELEVTAVNTPEGSTGYGAWHMKVLSREYQGEQP